jgi:hypothetical protein
MQRDRGLGKKRVGKENRMRPIDADALFEVIKKSMAENPHKEETQRAMHIHEHKYFLTLLAGIPTIQPVATDTNVGDTISRQEAIDVLLLGKEMLSRVLDDMDVVGTDREKYSWGLGLIESYINDIKELPPAQPEPQWIPVGERLPEKGGEYLVSVHHTIGAISVFHPEKDTYVDDVAIMKYYGKFPSTVRAWMPLPEAYKPNK